MIKKRQKKLTPREGLVKKKKKEEKKHYENNKEIYIYISYLSGLKKKKKNGKLFSTPLFIRPFFCFGYRETSPYRELHR